MAGTWEREGKTHLDDLVVEERELLDTKVENVRPGCEASAESRRKVPTLHADEKHVAPPLAREEGAALALALQQRVRGHSRAHPDALDPVQLEVLALRNLAPLRDTQNATDSAIQLSAKQKKAYPSVGASL